MKKALYIFILLTIAFYGNMAAQQSSQNIRGIILDKQSQFPIPGVNVIVMNSSPQKFASSDIDGKYKITELAPGRYDLKVSYIGYKELYYPMWLLHQVKKW
ncbi:MAG: carboxypeptidase-like regulatory domain-containing protein [Bacteroidetes bacterium]|nr:carboxypeptidase-like regulatory domain-containing protein [Bacteroidota bacterium]